MTILVFCRSSRHWSIDFRTSSSRTSDCWMSC